jgi:hypothetical protein
MIIVRLVGVENIRPQSSQLKSANVVGLPPFLILAQITLGHIDSVPDQILFALPAVAARAAFRPSRKGTNESD